MKMIIPNPVKNGTLLFLLLFFAITASAQIGIGINHADSSAILQVQDTAKGLLIPRMTAMQRIAIAAPAEGLLVYQLDGQNGIWCLTKGVWKNLMAQNNGGKHTLILSDNITDAEARLKIAQEAGPNTQEVKIIRCTKLTTVDLSVISSLDELLIANCPSLQAVNLENMKAAEGSIIIQNCPSLKTFKAVSLTGIGHTYDGPFGLQVMGTSLQNLNFPLLTQITGAVQIINNRVLDSINLPVLISFTNNANIFLGDTSSLSFINLNALTEAGSLLITSPSLTQISLPALTTALNISLYLIKLSALSLPALKIAGTFTLVGSDSLFSLNLPALTTVQEVFSFRGTSLNAIYLPQLTSAAGINFENCRLPEVLSFPALTAITGKEGIVTITSSSGLSRLEMPKIATLGLNISRCSSLASILLPAATKITYQFDVFLYPQLTNISFDRLVLLHIRGDLHGNQLPSSQINYLLHKFVSCIPANRNYLSFNLRQSVPAPPTGQGLTDKATLQARGISLQTD